MSTQPFGSWSRRHLLLTASATAAFAQQQEPAPASLKLPKLYAPTERESQDPPTPDAPGERIGIAVVGLGRLTLEQIVPALSECKHAKLAGLVSGNAEKAREFAQRHGLPTTAIYDYQTYDRLRDNPAVQAVYIVLPNSMHREYTVRAAQAGKHVLCEKPMANNAAECEEMIAACKKASRKLMIAYRMQYEPHLLRVKQMVQSGQLGPLRVITADNFQVQGDPEQWRLKKALAGGGALPDIGIYCLNSARFVVGQEPTEVLAHQYSTPGDPRFKEVEESIFFTLQFPQGIVAQCSSSYDAHTTKRMRVACRDGWADMDPAFSYNGLRLRVARKLDDQAEQATEYQLEQKNQFALEIDHFAQCVKQNQEPKTPGEEGLRDHRIMAKLYESARTGRPVRV